jgi:uncharacterized protein YndB with AHSA1/START domain
MKNSIKRELVIPKSREEVWHALTDSNSLAQWMHPNDFEPRVGHHFTFRVPPNPTRGFEGLTVRCEVLECTPPSQLAFSWTAGTHVVDTRVSYRLEPEGAQTRVYFEHSGFDFSQPHGEGAFKGSAYGWGQFFKQLLAVITGAHESNDSA